MDVLSAEIIDLKTKLHAALLSNENAQTQLAELSKHYRDLQSRCETADSVVTSNDFPSTPKSQRKSQTLQERSSELLSSSPNPGVNTALFVQLEQAKQLNKELAVENKRLVESEYIRRQSSLSPASESTLSSGVERLKQEKTELSNEIDSLKKQLESALADAALSKKVFDLNFLI